MALALVQKPEGFSGWWGNMAQEAPGGWALCLEAEFPASLPSSGAAGPGCLPLPVPGQGLLAGGLRLCVFVSYLLEHLCCPAHVWLWLTDQQ